MEQLIFNQLGQWTLLEKTTASNLPADSDFKSYRNFEDQGTLREDHGQKGKSHMGTSVPKHTSKKKMEVTIPTFVRSQYADNHPSLSTLT